MNKAEQGIIIGSHGYVLLKDRMGTDEDIVDAARISYDRRGKTEDRALIRYLLRHKHTTPFEMAVLKFEIKMPIFVARQWIRHRMASINEVSARYTQLPDEMFVPEVFSIQSTENKQGRGEKLEPHIEHAIRKLMQDANSHSYDTYEALLGFGVARETAREVLNLNIYTKFIWKIDLHNLMHFMNLRLDPHAQKEIREYAEIIEQMVKAYFPLTHEAFVDYIRDAYTCSRMEVELIRKLFGVITTADQSHIDNLMLEASMSMSKRELADFMKVFVNG